MKDMQQSNNFVQITQSNNFVQITQICHQNIMKKQSESEYEVSNWKINENENKRKVGVEQQNYTCASSQCIELSLSRSKCKESSSSSVEEQYDDFEDGDELDSHGLDNNELNLGFINYESKQQSHEESRSLQCWSIKEHSISGLSKISTTSKHHLNQQDCFMQLNQDCLMQSHQLYLQNHKPNTFNHRLNYPHDLNYDNGINYPHKLNYGHTLPPFAYAEIQMQAYANEIQMQVYANEIQMQVQAQIQQKQGNKRSQPSLTQYQQQHEHHDEQEQQSIQRHYHCKMTKKKLIQHFNVLTLSSNISITSYDPQTNKVSQNHHKRSNQHYNLRKNPKRSIHHYKIKQQLAENDSILMRSGLDEEPSGQQLYISLIQQINKSKMNKSTMNKSTTNKSTTNKSTTRPKHRHDKILQDFQSEE